MAVTSPTFMVLENEDELAAELREKFKAKYIDSPEKPTKFDERDVNRLFNDDRYALSFIQWKKGIIKDSLDMVAQVFEWRKEHNVTDISVDAVGEKIMERGVCYVHGRGLDGKRIMCLIGRLQTKDEKDQMRKLLIFWLERLQRCEPRQHITFILDTNKTAMSNVDLGMIRFIIDSFSTYFPDLLERIIILDMPWIMNAIWKIVKQWMSEEQRSRVFFCSRQDLGKFVAKDQLPVAMNGTSDWTYSFPPFPDDLSSQEHNFKDDPMNFKVTEKTESTDDPLVSGGDAENRPNGDVKHSESPAKTQEDVEEDDDQPGPSTSNHIPAADVKISPENRNSKRSSSPSSKASSDNSKSSQRRSSSRSPTRESRGSLRRRNTAESLDRKKTTMQQNLSFLSLAPGAEEGFGDAIRSSSLKNQSAVQSDEMVLGNLLVMSPVSELVFKAADDVLESFINIRNPNADAEEIDKRVNVAFKIKTTSPEKYHVKPSIGVLFPGESLSIRIYISPGYESSMSRDRFLLLYKPIPAEDERPNHTDIIKFWKINSEKTAHFEHRVRVRLDDSLQIADVKQDEGILKRGEAMAPESPQAGTSLVEKQELKGVDYAQLQQQIALLNNKITRIESDSRWIRRRFRHTMGLLFIVIGLLLLLFYEVIVLSRNMPLETSDSCQKS